MQTLLYKIITIFFVFLGGCSKGPTIPAQSKPFPVKIAYAHSKDIPLYISTIGHIEAYNSVQILSQVDGKLVKTYFSDGANVKRGDLLYLIDQRPYLTAVKRAEGELEKSIATLDLSKRRVDRNTILAQDKYISYNDYDNLTTAVLINNAIVKEKRAALENAKINLKHTTIYAPFDGIVGESQIHDGNLILKSSAKPLVTLHQITPIYATFYINEKELPRVQKNRNLKTEITTENAISPLHEGILTFVDNAVDLSTGMIKIKATFANKDKVLCPNQYVKVKFILDTLKNGIIIPIHCVQNSTKGKYVYVMKKDQTVERRNVQVGEIQENNTIVITKGLKEGERIVKEGQLNLYPGAKIRIISNEYTIQ